ncbi:unnamed protein product [Ectocarpus sp. CCAP 1310/34]|nr:unnamed protein product [Ectocarpus sp. CCAP 1310/34]
MSDSHDKSKTDAEMWAAFSEDAELFSEVVSLQDSHARGLCCIRCGLMDDFQQPGDKGWGMRGCSESFSVSAPEEANNGGKKFAKPFKCFFCRGVIGYSTPYLRMPHPLGGVNAWNNQPRFVYLHTDGASCVGKTVPTDTKAPCAGHCGKSSPDHSLYDMMGIGNDTYFFCDDCKYKRRAGVLGGVQELLLLRRLQVQAPRWRAGWGAGVHGGRAHQEGERRARRRHSACLHSSIRLQQRDASTGSTHGTAMDPAAVYVALFRATILEALNLLFPVTLEDLNQPPDRDILAIINYLHRLDKETLKVFLQDASRFTPASASLDAATDEGPTPSRTQRRRTTGRHGPGATRRVAHLIANSNNNCFFNSALALGLAAWDGPSPCPPPVCLHNNLQPNASFFPPSILRQSAARQARHDILHGTPITGAGCDMGNVAGVFEAIARACPRQGSPLWPDSVFDQQARVARTRRDFGLDWRYANNCTIGNHSAREVTPDQSARLRAATVITIPNGVSATFQDNVFDFFRSSAPTDLAIPGQSLCPYCADNVHRNMCDWTLLPWTSNTAPDRIFFRSSCVFRGLCGRWHKYDCLQGGIVTSSDAYDSGWHVSSVHMLVYLRSAICVATPPPYAPSSAATRSNVPRNACRVVQSEPTSPSGRMG